MAFLFRSGRFLLAPGTSLLVQTAVVAACLALALNWQSARRVELLISDVTHLQAEWREFSRSGSAQPQQRRTDFAKNLPVFASGEPVVSYLQRSSAGLGVTFVSITSSTRDSSSQSLGHLDLSVQLRGSYSNLKAVIAEARERFPGLVLQRVSLRRAAAPSDLEARAAFTVPTRPLAGTPERGLSR